MSEKKIELQPAGSYHFWWYIIGVLLIPVLIGFYVLYKKFRDLSNTSYVITDRKITAVHPDYTETVDLANINEVQVHQRWIDKRFGIGTLQLVTNTRKVDLTGLKNPRKISNILSKAAEAERLRIEHERTKEKEKSGPTQGNLDKLDYLTGLWQQGLISNDDFLKEKKHFDNS